VTLAPLLWVLMVATPMIAYFMRRRPTAPIARSWRLPLSSVRPGDWLAIAEPLPNRPVRLHPGAGNAHAARVLQVTRIGATGGLLCNLMGGHHLEARDNQLVTVFELADPRANDYSFHALGPIAVPTDDDDERRLVAVENNEQATADQIGADCEETLGSVGDEVRSTFRPPQCWPNRPRNRWRQMSIVDLVLDAVCAVVFAVTTGWSVVHYRHGRVRVAR